MTDYENIIEQCRQLPTIKLVEIMYSSVDDYRRKHPQDSYSDCQKAFMAAYNCARDELRIRYIEDIDSKVIENAFNHTSYADKEWLKWQKRKRKIAETRYQNPFFKKLKDNEIFVDEEFVDYEIHGYENVISIKGCRNFWDEDCKRISAIYYILSHFCGVEPQFIGLGDEVVFAVASDDYELESAFEYKPEYMNSRLRNRIDKIFRREYDKNLVLGCMLVEKYIHKVDPKVNAKVRCHDKDYLLGRFVMECPDKLFNTSDSIESIKGLAPKGKKIDAFIDLINNLVAPPWKDPF